MIELRPIRERPEDYDGIESRIQALFKRELYFPILREVSLPSATLQNAANDSLIKALRSGRVTFNLGKFSGKFNASISKDLKDLGATWNKRTNSFSLRFDKLPMDVKNVISSSESKFVEKLNVIDQKLAAIVPEQLVEKLKTKDLFDRALWRTETDFQKSVHNITVAPQLTEESANRISEEWQQNMDIWIKDFTEKQIAELRAEIKKTVYAGNRYESLTKTIQASYGVTARKAKFLARQETSLLMTKFKEVRYQESGINEYKWKSVSGSAAHPVRPRHKELNDASQKDGTIFKFDNPPITSAAGEPQRRNNPGQDYNCRCVAIPLVRFKK